MLKISIIHRNDNPNTIWNKLAARLGREPTNEEAKQEVLRILRDTKSKMDGQKPTVSSAKSPGQVAYEHDCEVEPNYGWGSGGKRKPWDKLSQIARDSWERNPTVRASALRSHRPK